MYDVHADPENAKTMVLCLALALKKRLPPNVILDDLIQDGTVGMIKIAERYDPAKGVPFCISACKRIRGAMINGFCDFDPIARSHRARAKVTGEQLPMTFAIRYTSQKTFGVSDDLAVESRNHVDERDAFEWMIRDLPKRSQFIFRLYFIDDLSLPQIAQAVGLTTPRIFQIIGEHLEKLRASVSCPSWGNPAHRAKLEQRQTRHKGDYEYTKRTCAA